MKPARIIFAGEEFVEQTPLQQLLDRFLLGYPRDGEIHRPDGVSISLSLPQSSPNPDVERRVREHNLSVLPDLPVLNDEATGLVIVPRGIGPEVNDAFIEQVLAKAGPATHCFVHGVLGSSFKTAAAHLELARTRKARVLVGTSLATTWRLPDVDVPAGSVVKESLIVTQGPWPSAELDGLQGVLPWIERSSSAKGGVTQVRLWRGPSVWDAGSNGEWSWALLAAALSRSDSPQGGAVLDGRTEDLVRLGLVPKLAREPRAWVVQHEGGAKTAILVLNGVVADTLLAVRIEGGSTLSAQLYRPPKPAQHEFSLLAAHIEDFLQGGPEPWPMERTLLVSQVLDACAQTLKNPAE